MFSDRQPIHLTSNRVLVHEIFVQFLASYLSLDIRDEVLDVFDGLALLGDLLEMVSKVVISHENLVQLGVAHITNLEEGAELVNLRHRS